MLKISRAALFAATLGFAAPVLPAMAQDSTQPMQAAPFAFEIKVPSVVAVDSSMSEDQIKDVFSSNFLTHADQLATLNATSITIPELTFSFTVDGVGGGTSIVTYRDIVLSNVKDGRAETLSIGSGESVSQGETTTYNALSADIFDLKRLLEFAGIVKGDPSAPLKPIYSSFTGNGSTQSGPLYSCTFGGSSSRALEARPVRVTLSEVLAVIEKFKDAPEPPPEAINTIVSYGVDILRAFRGGGGTIGAIDCTVPNETPVSIKMAGASTGDFESAIYPEIKVNGIVVDAGPMGSGSLGEFQFKPLDLNPTLNALDEAAGQLNEAWFETNWRLLIPSWDGFSFANFAIDATSPDMPADPAMGMPARPGEHIEAKVASFDLSLGKYFLGIPTDVSMSGSGIEVPLPQDSTDPQINTLLAAGLTGVNMGFDVAAAWDEAAKIITVEKLALAAVDLGSMSISANIGNATEQLFAVDPNVSMAAGFGLTVKDFTINATDDGLGKIIWPLAAAEQGVTDVEAYRLQMAGLFEGMAIQLIGPTDAARQLGAAISDFVVGGKTEITINIKSKDPNGIPMAMFIAAQTDPTILTGQIEITGMAN
ncbi:MAG: hypothetical protein ABIY37_04425 [Devosia sp.]